MKPSVDTAILPVGGTNTAASSAVRSLFAKCALNTWSISSDVCLPPAPCAIVTVLFSIMNSFFLVKINLYLMNADNYSAVYCPARCSYIFMPKY